MAEKVITLECSVCKTIFQRALKQHKYALKKSGTNYKPRCNIRCKTELRSLKVKLKCDNCNIDFEKVKYHVMDNNFCSKSCSTKFFNAKRKKICFSTKGRLAKLTCVRCSVPYETSIHTAKNTLCTECKDAIRIKFITVSCVKCNSEFQAKKRIGRSHKNYCDKCFPLVRQECGKKSASQRTDKKRSKNEIYLAELCEKEFGNISTNKPMFNGWDSDIQLYDYKLAIHWNGAWHYVFCGGHHSLKQVQSRDKIKYRNVEECGWQNYIIKDMGKADKKLVEIEFEKLKNYINAWFKIFVSEGI